MAIPGDEGGALTITHVGSSNFAVWSLDEGDEQIDLLVNTIGPYVGTVIVNLYDSDPRLSALEITADGTWTVQPLRVEDFPVLDLSAGGGGTGDAVYLLSGGATRGEITHDGESNFAVRVVGTEGVDLAVNEIGPYSGTIRFPGEPLLVVVQADGNWTLTGA